jgi:uncharacterized protein YutE (UPF0331/DUF86 family)
MPFTLTTPDCEFQTVSAEELLDGLRTLKGKSGDGLLVPSSENGPDTFLAWAIHEVADAAQASEQEEVKRLSANAVMNSRRALACLVDWYIERDLAAFCKDRPDTPKKQAAFLVRRGVIDELTSRVLERAITQRNKLEHEYISPTLSQAEDFVELLRRTIFAIRAHSDPSHGPWVFGIFLSASGIGKEGPYAHFGGWNDSLVVFSRFPPRPWVGILIPENCSRALVRRSFLDCTATDLLIDILSMAEQKYGHPGSFQGSRSCEMMARAMGLMSTD